jgi:hypothetical protein
VETKGQKVWKRLQQTERVLLARWPTQKWTVKTKFWDSKIQVGTISNLLLKMRLICKYINTMAWYITISHSHLLDSARRNKQEWIQKTLP